MIDLLILYAVNTGMYPARCFPDSVDTDSCPILPTGLLIA